MTTTQIIVVIVAVLALIAVLLARSGPRVTTIETTREREKDSDDA